MHWKGVTLKQYRWSQRHTDDILILIIDQMCLVFSIRKNTSTTIFRPKMKMLCGINRSIVAFLTTVTLQHCVLLLLNRWTAKDKKLLWDNYISLYNYFSHFQDYKYNSNQIISHNNIDHGTWRIPAIMWLLEGRCAGTWCNGFPIANLIWLFWFE